MLEKLAAGLLGNAVSGIAGSLFGGAKKTGAATDEGIFTTLLGDAGGTDAAGGGLSASASDGIDPGTKEAMDMLHEMTSGGLAGYWKFMMKQMREKVMEGMGVTEESLAAMDPAQRSAIEEKIADAVKQALAKAMGVSPDDAGKMMAQADQVTGVNAAGKLEASKAYKDGHGKGSTEELVKELLMGS